MNKIALQLFLVLAFIPIAILISSINITLAPLYCWGLAINAYRFNNTKELYFLHKASESCGDSGNIKNAHDAKSITNNF